MNCEFCNNPCRKDADWWECHHCEASYRECRLFGRHIKFERTKGEWSYALNIYPQANRTVLTGANREPRIIKLEIPYTLKNVNQHNAMDKIRMLLIFQ